MKIFKKLSSIYPYVIAALVLMLCLMVWPMQLIGNTSYESSSLESGIFPNLELADSSAATCKFTPSHARLDQISFRFLCTKSAPEGSLVLTLYDDQQKKIYDTTLESGDVMNYRWIHFPIDLQLIPGQTYIWQLRAHDYDKDEVSLALYSGGISTGPAEAGEFYYNGSYQEHFTPAVVYSYTDRADQRHAMPYYLIFLLIGLLLFTAIRKCEQTNEDEKS